MKPEIYELEEKLKQARKEYYQKMSEIYEPVLEVEKELKSAQLKYVHEMYEPSDLSCDHKDNPIGRCIFPKRDYNKNEPYYAECMYCGWDEDRK